MAINRPPAIGSLPKVAYPEIPDAVLGNGLRILSIEDHTLPKVSIQLAWPVGRTSCPSRNLALLNLAIDLLEEGTENRSSRQIADFLDQLSIHYGGQVWMEQSRLSLTVLSRYLESALELVSDLVLCPTFPEEELEKVKTRWRSYLLSQRSQPSFLAQERTYSGLYGSHPYSRVSVPADHLAAADREDVRGLYKQLLVPDGALLVVSGPVGLDRTVCLAERFLGQWKGNVFKPESIPPIPELDLRRILLVHRPHSAQARILVAGKGLSRGHAAEVPLTVSNQVLGGGASARLFLNLREEKGYTYGAYSSLNSYRGDGVLLASADVRTDVAVESAEEILKEIERMSQGPPSSRELSRCQSELVGGFLRRMETPDSVASLEVNRRLDHLPEDHYRNYVVQLQGVTPQLVHETSQTYMDPARTIITVVADRSQVETDLARLGKLSVYDTEANRIE